MRKKKWPDKRSKKRRLQEIEMEKSYQNSPWRMLENIDFSKWEYQDDFWQHITGYDLYIVNMFMKGTDTE